jgi:hypothetical protein
MTMPRIERRLVQTIGFLFVSAVANGGPPAAPDAWSKVPSLPTGCYVSRDSFAKDTDAAIEAVSAERTRQEDINRSIEDALKNLEPMEKQKRMQTFLMSNPQEAVKMMQANQAAGTEVQGTAMERNEKAMKLDEELNTLESQYDAELNKAIAPIDARIKALNINDGEGGNPPGLVDQWKALIAKRNAEYERVCGTWWTASSPVHGWLKRYKEHLQENVAVQAKVEDAVLTQYKMMGIPAGTYRSTEAMNAAETYMKRARGVFDRRWLEPQKPQ